MCYMCDTQCDRRTEKNRVTGARHTKSTKLFKVGLEAAKKASDLFQDYTIRRRNLME